MNQRQQSLRSEAARAFMESLDQLQETLQPETLQPSETQPVSPTAPETDKPSRAEASFSDPFDLSSFEQAVADIEAFIQMRQQDEKSEE